MNGPHLATVSKFRNRFHIYLRSDRVVSSNFCLDREVCGHTPVNPNDCLLSIVNWIAHSCATSNLIEILWWVVNIKDSIRPRIRFKIQTNLKSLIQIPPRALSKRTQLELRLAVRLSERFDCCVRVVCETKHTKRTDNSIESDGLGLWLVGLSNRCPIEIFNCKESSNPKRVWIWVRKKFNHNCVAQLDRRQSLCKNCPELRESIPTTTTNLPPRYWILKRMIGCNCTIKIAMKANDDYGWN